MTLLKNSNTTSEMIIHRCAKICFALHCCGIFITVPHFVNFVAITVVNNETKVVNATTNMLYLSDCAYWYKCSIYLTGVSCFLTLLKATRFCYMSRRLTLLCEAIQEAVTHCRSVI